MNDFDYDSMQKKRIARGAMNKVRHTGCTLPHEHLTKKELKKMNGEVKTYKLDAPMTWMEFRKLPEDLKKKYIANLRALYHANCTMLARMFDVKINTLSEYFKAHSIARFSSKEGTKYGKDKNIQAAWEAFCNGVIGGGNNVKEVKEKNAEKKLEEFSDTKQGAFKFDRVFNSKNANWCNNKECNKTFLLCQQNYFNEILKKEDYVTFGRILRCIDFPSKPYDETVGWLKGENITIKITDCQFSDGLRVEFDPLPYPITDEPITYQENMLKEVEDEDSKIIEKDSVTVPVKRMEMEFRDIRSMESLIEQLPKIAFPGFTKVVIYIEKEN